MKEIFVKEMFECPFQYDTTYPISDMTSGVDTMCTQSESGDCVLKDCPLKNEEEIKVTWFGPLERYSENNSS